MFLFFLDYQEVIKVFFVFVRLSDIDVVLCFYTNAQACFWHAAGRK